MKQPFVLIAAIVAVVGLATTPQSGLADEGAAVSSKDKPGVQCWTTFPARGGEAKPKVGAQQLPLRGAPRAVVRRRGGRGVQPELEALGRADDSRHGQGLLQSFRTFPEWMRPT